MNVTSALPRLFIILFFLCLIKDCKVLWLFEVLNNHSQLREYSLFALNFFNNFFNSSNPFFGNSIKLRFFKVLKEFIIFLSFFEAFLKISKIS